MVEGPTCPETGKPMFRDRRSTTIRYRGLSVTFEMPGWYCEGSGQSIHTGDDMKTSDRMLNRLKSQSEGLLSPDEIRRIRKKLSLSQVSAGELIGGGPRAFQKYEAGDLLPSRAVSSALALLDNAPNGLRILEARARPNADHSPSRGIHVTRR